MVSVRGWLLVVALAIAWTGAVAPLHAQVGAAALTGSVSDPAGAPGF